MKNKLKTTFLIITLIVFGCSKSENMDEQAPVSVPYNDITVIDIHNHDASGYRYRNNMRLWNKYGIDKTVLFGDISEPSAMTTDQIAFNAYLVNKDRIIPFIAGINLHDESCLDYIENQFSRGVMGIGEIVGASTYSPITSNLPWKAEHPMDGYLPEIYELCAEYNKPILLHIDPPTGYPIEKLKEAAAKYPNTKFIFAHANAYNSPANIESLLQDFDNIYMDFYVGFTVYNAESTNDLSDFISLINQYPDKFMVSTDSGTNITNEDACFAIYELFNLLEEDIVVKIAGENFLSLLGLAK